MTKKIKITIAIRAVLVLGEAAAYFFTIGPLGNPVLASVNGEKITVALFQKELAKIDPANRGLIAQDPAKLLDFMVNRALLLQQMKKEGVTAAPAFRKWVRRASWDAA